jgi:hypothetical protein
LPFIAVEAARRGVLTSRPTAEVKEGLGHGKGKQRNRRTREHRTRTTARTTRA